jgi:hypothetical protein
VANTKAFFAFGHGKPQSSITVVMQSDAEYRLPLLLEA